MTPSKNSSLTRLKSPLIGSLLAGSLVAGALLGASREAHAEIRTTPASACAIPVTATTLWTGPAGLNGYTSAQMANASWRNFYIPNNIYHWSCPINSANGFVPQNVYVDFSLAQASYYPSAQIVRRTYDGTTVETKPIFNATLFVPLTNYGPGPHDVGSSLSFTTTSPWDYYEVQYSWGLDPSELIGVGYSN
jgi:hypothetical protein